tara:strand:- start:2235 stop:2810 length:576 start_codon:yes stop_codon:yes gene_type:complete
VTDILEPVFTHKEPGPFFSASEAAARIAETGEEKGPVATQLRTLAQRRLVQVRGTRGSGRTASNLYAPADLAVASIMRTLIHMGVADNEVLRAASLACYSWREGDDIAKGFAHPMTAALASFIQLGEAWTFRMDLDFNATTGRRFFVARLYNPETSAFPEREDPTTVPMATITIPVLRFVPRVLVDTSGMN